MGMTLCLDEKFDKYIAGRYVDPSIPDELLEELKQISSKLKEVTGKDYFDFPR